MFHKFYKKKKQKKKQNQIVQYFIEDIDWQIFSAFFIRFLNLKEVSFYFDLIWVV